MRKIFICGGHLSPALAVIEKLQRDKEYKIYYIGRRYALEGDNADSLEFKTVQKLGISFLSLTTGRLQRSFTWHTLISLLKMPVGFIQSFYYLISIRPHIVVSFGSYLALPVCLNAWIVRIPIITHEQTFSLGLANKIIARFSQVLALSYADTKGIPKKVRTEVTGNPLRETLFAANETKITDFGDKNLPLIYVTGGNLGSRAINKIIGELLPFVLTNYRIIHQCGNADNEADFRYLTRVHDALSPKLKSNYKLITHIDPSMVGPVLRHTKVIIGRSGANTVNEIIYFGIPAILIPLPWSGQAEQEKNARIVEQIGLGEIIMQKDLNPEKLGQTIEFVMKNFSHYHKSKDKTKENMQSDSLSRIEKLIKKYAKVS